MVEQTGVLSAYGHVFRLSRRGLRQELLQFLERVAHVLGVPFRRLLHLGIISALPKAPRGIEPHALQPFADRSVLRPQVVGLHPDERSPHPVERDVGQAVRGAEPVLLGDVFARCFHEPDYRGVERYEARADRLQRDAVGRKYRHGRGRIQPRGRAMRVH